MYCQSNCSSVVEGSESHTQGGNQYLERGRNATKVGGPG